MEPQRGIILDQEPPTRPPTHPPAALLFFPLLHNLGSWNLVCNLSSQKWDATRCLGHLSRQYLSWWHLSWWHSSRSFCTHYCHTRLHHWFPARLKIWQIPACKMEPQIFWDTNCFWMCIFLRSEVFAIFLFYQIAFGPDFLGAQKCFRAKIIWM